jgi:hypothetical protein
MCTVYRHYSKRLRGMVFKSKPFKDDMYLFYMTQCVPRSKLSPLQL